MISFKKLAENYRAIFFDAYGVLNGVGGMLPGINQALAEFNAAKKPFLILSNDSSTSLENLTKKYDDERLGQLIKPSQVICSGLIAQHYLTKHHMHAKIVYFGPPTCRVFLEPATKNIISIAEIDADHESDVFALMDGDNSGEVLAVMAVNGYDWQTCINKAINLIRQRPNIELIAPNPDLLYFAGAGKVGVAAGSIAGFLESIINRKFKYFGKPYRGIFEFGLQEIRKSIPDIKPSEILMVGDNLMTDVKGANEFGLVSVLVLSGNTPKEIHEQEIARTGQKPNFICDSMAT